MPWPLPETHAITLATDERRTVTGTSPAVQRLRLCAPTAEDAGSISGRGTRTLHVSNAAKKERKVAQNPHTRKRAGSLPWLSLTFLERCLSSRASARLSPQPGPCPSCPLSNLPAVPHQHSEGAGSSPGQYRTHRQCCQRELCPYEVGAICGAAWGQTSQSSKGIHHLGDLWGVRLGVWGDSVLKAPVSHLTPPGACHTPSPWTCPPRSMCEGRRAGWGEDGHPQGC